MTVGPWMTWNDRPGFRVRVRVRVRVRLRVMARVQGSG